MRIEVEPSKPSLENQVRAWVPRTLDHMDIDPNGLSTILNLKRVFGYMTSAFIEKHYRKKLHKKDGEITFSAEEVLTLALYHDFKDLLPKDRQTAERTMKDEIRGIQQQQNNNTSKKFRK